MVKIIKKDYPWTIIVEDKISKNQNPYVSIGVGFTEKDNQAQSEAEKYKTTWTNLVRLEDLLKLSSSAENAYQQYKFRKDAEKQTSKQSAPAPAKPDKPATYADMDDDIPFA
jgi:hypothetical protein